MSGRGTLDEGQFTLTVNEVQRPFGSSTVCANVICPARSFNKLGTRRILLGEDLHASIKGDTLWVSEKSVCSIYSHRDKLICGLCCCRSKALLCDVRRELQTSRIETCTILRDQKPRGFISTYHVPICTPGRSPSECTPRDHSTHFHG